MYKMFPFKTLTIFPALLFRPSAATLIGHPLFKQVKYPFL